MMRFKNFEIRSTQPSTDSNGNREYEIVKWQDNGSYCFVVGFLTRKRKREWKFRSVGMRYFKHWEYGLERYISACCDLVDACTVDEADV